MKKYIFLLLSLIIFIGWYFNREMVADYINKNFPGFAKNPIVKSISEDISNPPPLISNIFSSKAHLTLEGTIQETNLNRAQNGNLPAMVENQKLDQAAKLKLDDMFKQQYFEHVNPQGIKPGDLAKKVGYQYITEGENLALGNFDNDKVLVTAWMNSPGHRANILNSHYTQIGVAVGEGMYEGKKTWLAVQEFGRPASDCPSVDTALKEEIKSSQAEIDSLQLQLTSQKSQLDALNPQTQPEYADYKQKLDNYNNSVHIYNNKVDVLKQITAQYNDEVSAYNTCLANS